MTLSHFSNHIQTLCHSVVKADDIFPSIPDCLQCLRTKLQDSDKHKLLDRFNNLVNGINGQIKQFLKNLEKRDYVHFQTHHQQDTRSVQDKVKDRSSPSFVDLYAVIQQSVCLCEIDFNDYFCRERFQKLYDFKDSEGLATLDDAFMQFSPLAFSRLLNEQETLKHELLSFVHKKILQDVGVHSDVYQSRLQEEMETWHEKQAMALSPHSLLRKQADEVNSTFTRVHHKLIEFRGKQTSNNGQKVTHQKLREYLERLGQLSQQMPERVSLVYDLLLHQMKIYPDQVVCKLQQDGHKVSISQLQEFTLVQ